MNTSSVVAFARRLVIGLLFVCELVQYFVDESLVNTACAFIAVVGSTATMLYVLNINRFRRAPLSGLMILGFNISALSGALLIQSAYLKPIVYNLDVALQTFGSLIFTQFMIIAVHYLYLHSRTLRGLRSWLTHKVFTPIGLLTAPSDAELWVFGLVGCGATMLSARNYTDAIQYGDVSSKFALGYVPFAVAPYFIPMRAYLLGDTTDRAKSGSMLLIAYTLMLIAVAMANNARATFSSGFLTLALSCIVAVLSGNFQLTARRVATSLLMVGFAIPVFLTLSDLATAMVIARDERSNVSSLELIEITLNNFQDKTLIEERRHRDAVISGGEYNENYITNPILARFVYTKFVDVNMNNALTLSDGQAEEIRKGTRARIMSMLPTPVISFFGLSLDKADLTFSSGDLYSYIARGLELGGYTTGSEIPDGLTIFGTMFWPVLSLLVLVQFLIYDALAKRGPDGRLQLGAVVLLNIVPIFTLGVMQESVSNQVVAIVRGVPQLIVLYSVLKISTAIALQPLIMLKQFGTKVQVARR